MTYDSFINSPFNEWQEIDMIVSRDCTLRCTYCYLNKSKDNEYDINKVIQGLDSVMQTCDKEGVVLSFYPEPWVNIERTNELVKRSLQTLLKYPKYVSNYMISIGTNGVNLGKKIPALESQKEHLSIAVTLDGIKEQHDMYRVFPDGSPSWDLVKNNILKYRFQCN